MTSLHAAVLTLFPEMFPGTLGYSLAGKALQQGHWQLDTVNIRDFGHGKHAQVDDTPAGGGAGMVMRPDVLGDAIEAILPAFDSPPAMLMMSPRGAPITQKRIKKLVNQKNMLMICGRFEGVDQRVLDHYAIEEVSVGDVILFGGEVAAQLVLEACVRLLPNVLGGDHTLEEESFALDGWMNGLLEYPHYTRPAQWQGLDVPDVLTSGHHGNILQWRQAQAEELTESRRPDLWAKRLKT